MEDVTHQAILEGIAENINDEKNVPPEGFDDLYQDMYGARYFAAGKFLKTAGLKVGGIFPGIPSRFTDIICIWLEIVDGMFNVRLVYEVYDWAYWEFDERIKSKDSDL